MHQVRSGQRRRAQRPGLRWSARIFAASATIAAATNCKQPTNSRVEGDEQKVAVGADPYVLPGASALAEPLRLQLAAAAQRQITAQPLQQHAGRFRNRLLLESSPYLLQHATQPVNWFAWDEPAFAAARAEKKLIFLSIGYSSCHWCHVMAEESFDSVEVATALNQQMIAIKVDREERPDIDALYQDIARQRGVDGGWPLTVIMTPERNVLAIATYLPPQDNQRGFRSGLITLLANTTRAVRDNPALLKSPSTNSAGPLPVATGNGNNVDAADVRLLGNAITQLLREADPSWGGFGARAKFPMVDALRFCLRMAHRTNDNKTREVIILALERMAAGGIHDQLAGGFHRYTTDARWQIPHFEKMLVDQADLASLYVDGFRLTGDSRFAAVAKKTLAFVQAELADPRGGYFSAIDADIDGKEGAQYSWSKAEVDKIVGAADAELVSRAFDITTAGNLREGGRGQNVLWRRLTDQELATALSIPLPDVTARLAIASEKLRVARQSRRKPHVDNKRLTDVNARLLSALITAATTFQDPDLLKRAQTLAEWLLQNARTAGGVRHVVPSPAELLASSNSAIRVVDGFLDDYALLASAMIDLYEADGNTRWLEAARAIQSDVHKTFFNGGLYFYSPEGGDPLISRLPAASNGTGASGIAATISNYLRLASLLDDEGAAGKMTSLQRAQLTLAAYRSQLSQLSPADPLATAAVLGAIEMSTDQIKQIVVVASPSQNDSALAAVIFSQFLPNRVIARVANGSTAELAIARNKKAIAGKATAYVCVDGACALPTSDPAILEKQLRKTTPLSLPPGLIDKPSR
jgi:uncharacterized protein